MAKFAATSAKLHIAHSHGHPVGDVAKGIFCLLLASTSSCVALMATLMGEYPKILYSCVLV